MALLLMSFSLFWFNILFFFIKHSIIFLILMILLYNCFILFATWYLIYSCSDIGSCLIAGSASDASVLIQFLCLWLNCVLDLY